MGHRGARLTSIARRGLSDLRLPKKPCLVMPWVLLLNFDLKVELLDGLSWFKPRRDTLSALWFIPSLSTFCRTAHGKGSAPTALGGI